MAGWGTTYTWRCDLVDTSNSPMTLRVSQSKICCHFLWMFNLLSSQLLSSFIFRWFKLHGCFIFQNTLNFLIPSVYYFYLYLIYIPKIFHFKVVPHVHVRLSSGFFFFVCFCRSSLYWGRNKVRSHFFTCSITRSCPGHGGGASPWLLVRYARHHNFHNFWTIF